MTAIDIMNDAKTANLLNNKIEVNGKTVSYKEMIESGDYVRKSKVVSRSRVNKHGVSLPLKNEKIKYIVTCRSNGGVEVPKTIYALFDVVENVIDLG